ncbi:hypothetical protein Gotri_014364 [Gossypium trilobum]|uniref:Uncharacterized protein n=1 Tax=Gossypium trilobum TaxID=34281 RepID=A0A7J9DWH8_9ROSI|nr:hypothetical protein [Gossypium trilobum]
MVVDTMTTPTLSWKDLVLGNKSDGQKVVDEINPLDKDFALQDGDVNKSIVNGIPSISFLERIHQLLVEEMATSVKGDIMGNWGFDQKSNKTRFQYRQQGKRMLCAEVYSNRSPLSTALDVLLQSFGFASTAVEPSTAVESSTGKENTTCRCWWSENPGANLVNPINLEGLKKGRKSRVQDFNL